LVGRWIEIETPDIQGHELGEKDNNIVLRGTWASGRSLTEAYKTEATRTGSAALVANIINDVQVAVMKVDWARERLIRSALDAPILAMMHHLSERNAQEIGEVLGHLNDVSSDFGPGQILRGLKRRTPLPHYHHRISTRFGQHLFSDPPKSGQVHCFTDFWKAYQAVIPEEQHSAVGKETGETAHVERWNNTLR